MKKNRDNKWELHTIEESNDEDRDSDNESEIDDNESEIGYLPLDDDSDTDLEELKKELNNQSHHQSTTTDSSSGDSESQEEYHSLNIDSIPNITHKNNPELNQASVKDHKNYSPKKLLGDINDKKFSDDLSGHLNPRTQSPGYLRPTISSRNKIRKKTQLSNKM